MTDDIPANPGFWLHYVPGNYETGFEHWCFLIIAWRKTEAGYTPITTDGGRLPDTWDSAIECPDGTCVNDMGRRYPNCDSWLEDAEVEFFEHCKELREAKEI